MTSLRNSCLLTFSPLIHVKETLIQTSCLSNQSLWFNRNYEIENPSFRSLKIFIRQTDKWHCQINANCQLTSQRVVVAITVCAAWCAWTVNGAGPDVVSGCACIASFEFRRGKFKRSEEKFLNRHGTSKFLIVIWFITGWGVQHPPPLLFQRIRQILVQKIMKPYSPKLEGPI